jgi:hypothetical protein
VEFTFKSGVHAAAIQASDPAANNLLLHQCYAATISLPTFRALRIQKVESAHQEILNQFAISLDVLLPCDVREIPGNSVE